MDNCLLCLKAPSTCNNYIPINSEKWWQADVLGIIEKHFWPIYDLPNMLGICFLCWTKLNEFHIFYQNIEEAHRKMRNISKENKFTSIATETDLFEASQDCEFDVIETGKTEFSVGEFTDHNIKIEGSFNECECSTRTNNQNTSSPMCKEKRKRGRPRKNHKILVSKPKGKRGRPRKNSQTVLYNTIVPKGNIDTIVQQLNSNTELETPQCTFVTSSGNCSPSKKKRRGRPRKIANSDDNSKKMKEIIELPVMMLPGNDELSVKECSEDEKSLTDKCSNLKETVKIINKKRKCISLLQKRKPMQQHKALMRNYIATSVRCMKFFKK